MSSNEFPSPSPKPPQEESHFVGNFFRDLWKIHTQPRSFFRSKKIASGAWAAVTFALVTHWIGSVGEFFWKKGAESSLRSRFQGFYQQFQDMIDDRFDYVDSAGHSIAFPKSEEVLNYWFLSAGKVIADPFFTIVGLLFTSFFVYLGARILISPGENGAIKKIRYETALIAVSYGMAPSILRIVPFVGSVASSLLSIFVTVIAVRELFKIDTGRAIIVGLFPKLLFSGVILFGILALFIPILLVLFAGMNFF